jgi:hypothetical protein
MLCASSQNIFMFHYPTQIGSVMVCTFHVFNAFSLLLEDTALLLTSVGATHMNYTLRMFITMQRLPEHISMAVLEGNNGNCILYLKLKLTYDHWSVSQFVLVLGSHLEPMTRFLFSV